MYAVQKSLTRSSNGCCMAAEQKRPVSAPPPTRRRRQSPAAVAGGSRPRGPRGGSVSDSESAWSSKTSLSLPLSLPPSPASDRLLPWSLTFCARGTFRWVSSPPGARWGRREMKKSVDNTDLGYVNASAASRKRKSAAAKKAQEEDRPGKIPPKSPLREADRAQAQTVTPSS
jgi:hypothetical protein